VGQTQGFSADRWSGLFEICRHPAVIPVNSREDLIFSQLRGSAVSVTWRSFFVESHDEKLQQEAARVRRRCPVFLWEFSSPAMGPVIQVCQMCVRLSLIGARSIYSKVRSCSPTVSRAKVQHLEG